MNNENNPSYKDGPLIMEQPVENKTLTLVGVSHTIEYAFEFHKVFEKIIESNEAVVLEQTVNGDFWESPFFGEIAKIVRRENKKIYPVDPVNISTTVTDLAISFAGASLIADSLLSEKELTRRNFIKRLFGFGIGASMFAGSLPGLIMKDRFGNIFSENYHTDDSTTYGETDYRNIVIAEGLERLLQNTTYQKIAAIHGWAHNNSILKYLTNPKLRSKKIAYLPYTCLGNEKVREYTPTKTGWNLTQTF